MAYHFFEGHIPATQVTMYDSLGRIKEVYYRNDEDAEKELIKTINQYNEKHALLRSVSFGYKRRLKKILTK